MLTIIYWLDIIGVAIFAITGALVASRKQMDIVGFILIATFTGIGGGTIRDLLVGATPVFWVKEPLYPFTCLASAVIVYFTAHFFESRYKVLLWLDALGLSMFCITGAAKALSLGVHPGIAMVLGMISATFGGLVRDVVCNEIPLIMRREIYAIAAALGAVIYVACVQMGLPTGVPALIAFFSAFGLRASALIWGWGFPVYKTRPGRDYPNE